MPTPAPGRRRRRAGAAMTRLASRVARCCRGVQRLRSRRSTRTAAGGASTLCVVSVLHRRSACSWLSWSCSALALRSRAARLARTAPLDARRADARAAAERIVVIASSALTVADPARLLLRELFARPRARAHRRRANALHRPRHRPPMVVGGALRATRAAQDLHHRERDPHSGRPSRCGSTLASTDVIHSFWVPNLHGKKDLIPGRSNHDRVPRRRARHLSRPMRRVLRLPARAHGAADVVAEPPSEFDAWLDAAAAAGARRRPTSSASTGREVFLRSACVDVPHDQRHRCAAARVGPDLTHVASRRTIAAGTLPKTPRQPRRLDRRSARRSSPAPTCRPCRCRATSCTRSSPISRSLK